MHRRLIVSLAVVAAVVAAPAPASASQTIARNATHVRLAVNKNRVALLTYRSEGRLHHTLAWGAINARTPRRGLRQVSFRLDYAGGWGSRRKDLWRGFKNACGPYQGPALNYVVAACTAPDGSHWVVQKWRRLLPPFGMRPTFAQRAVELQLSHCLGRPPRVRRQGRLGLPALRPPVRLAQVQGQGRLRVQRDEVRLAARQVGPERLRRHVRLALRPRLEARERFPDASLERRLLLRLLPAREPAGRQGTRVPRDRDGPRCDADHVLARRGARPVRPRRSTSSRTRNSVRSSRTRRLGARFARGTFSAAEDVPLWVYVLLAFAIALLGAAASLPKSETVGLSASLLLGLVGATILLGLPLTITYALRLRAAKDDRRGLL